MQPGLATIVSGIPSTDDDTTLHQPGVHSFWPVYSALWPARPASLHGPAGLLQAFRRLP